MKHLRLLALLVIVALVVLAVGVGGWEFVSNGDRVEAYFSQRKVVGPLVFIFLMWVVQPVGVPGVFFMVPAALVWPAPTAMALSWIGNMGASFVAFAFARWVAREWTQARLSPRIHRWDRRVSSGGVGQVVLLRIATGQLPPADWLLGVSSVKVRPFLIGTAIGIIPGIVAAVLLGEGLASWLTNGSSWWPLALVAAFAVALVRRWRGRRRVDVAQQ